jgi:16S rRNA (guanine1207-N2)-methyltransferase
MLEKANAAEALLVEHALFPVGQPAALIGAGQGAAAVAIGQRCAPHTLALADGDLLALRRAAAALRAAGLPLAADQPWSLAPALAGGCAGVALLAPPQRDLARRRLLEAYAALRPGGTLFLAGAKAEGVESIAGDGAALFGSMQLLAYRKGCRVSAATCGPAGPLPGWAAEPGIMPGSWCTLSVDLPTGPVELHSLPGIFSYDRLDPGSSLLLSQLAVRPAERVLDLGCGYGVLGIAAALAGAAHVTLSDVSLLAVAAASENVARLAPGRCTVLAADGLGAAQGPYDLIVTNQPIALLSARRPTWPPAGAFCL